MFNVRIREISHALSLSIPLTHTSSPHFIHHFTCIGTTKFIALMYVFCLHRHKLPSGNFLLRFALQTRCVCCCVLLFFLSHIDNMSLYAFRYHLHHTTPYYTIPYIHKARTTLLEWLCFVLECVARFLCLSYFFCKDFIALGVVFST